MTDDRLPFSLANLGRRIANSREILLKLLIAGVTVTLLALMFPRGESVSLEYKVGAVWAERDLIAPFSFPILREEKEYTREVEEARTKTYQVFERDSLVPDAVTRRVGAFFDRLREALNARAEYRKSQRARALTVRDDSLRYARLAEALEIPFNEREWTSSRSRRRWHHRQARRIPDGDAARLPSDRGAGPSKEPDAPERNRDSPGNH